VLLVQSDCQSDLVKKLGFIFLTALNFLKHFLLEQNSAETTLHFKAISAFFEHFPNFLYNLAKSKGILEMFLIK